MQWTLIDNIDMNEYDIELPFECCKYCNNNPKNNPSASGICHCALPSLETQHWRINRNLVGYYYTTTTNDLYNIETMSTNHRGMAEMSALKESWLYR